MSGRNNRRSALLAPDFSSLQKAGILILAFVAIWLAGSSQAEADDCMSASACSTAASWTQAVANDDANKAAWFRATSKQNFINAYEWGQKATFAFHAGDATAAAWYKAIADDYSQKAVADAKAADEYTAQAQYYFNASQDSLNRSEFFGVLGEGSDLSIASSDRPKCEHAVHHPTDPDGFGSGKPNSYGCEYWDYMVRACDRDVDGHRVKVEWVGSNDNAYWWGPPEGGEDHPWSSGWAPSQGCHDENIGGSGIVIKLRVCVEDEKCSPWRRNIG